MLCGLAGLFGLGTDLKHGVKKTTLKALRLGLARRESPEEEPKKNGSDTRKDA